MVTLQYPLRDLTRRRAQTLTLLACLIFSSASATFLFLMGLSLGLNIAILPWRMSIGLNYVFSRYIVIALVLSLLTGALIISNVQITFTNQRQRDIGIMKAIGLAEETGSFLIAEAAITTIIGCSIGSGLGTATYSVSIKILNAFGYGLTPILPFIPLFILFIIVILISFAFTYLPMSRTLLRLNAIEAISTNLTRRTGSEGFFGKVRMNLSYRIALRSLRTRGKETLRIIAASLLCIMLVSILIFGGQTISSTTSNYVERGIGKDIFLIANPKIVEKYVKYLSFYPLESGSPVSDDLWQSCEVSKGFIEWLEAQSFIETVDTRIVTNAKAYEIRYIEPIPEGYTIIGDNRSANTLVIGIDPEKVASNWVLNGRFLTKEDQDNAVIGDAVLDIIYNFSVEKIKVIGKTFSIAGVCIDPLNMGYTIYIPYETASSILGVSNPNIVLIKVNANAKGEAIDKIGQMASKEGLAVLDLNPVLERNVNLVERLWNFILIFPIMTLISLIICLVSFLQLITLSRISDFQVMRTIGAKWKDISKIVSAELFIIIISSIPFGILIGLIIALNFLILSPIFPQVGALFFSFSIIIGFTVLLFIGSNYVITKTIKKQIYHG